MQRLWARRTFLLVMCGLLTAGLSAQEEKSLRLGDFTADSGISPNELRAFVDMVSAYLAELKGFRLQGEETGIDPHEPLAEADIVVSAHISQVADGLSLEMTLVENGGGNRLMARGSFLSMNELALKSRQFTRNLLTSEFSDGQEDRELDSVHDAALPTPSHGPLLLSSFVGTWRGDRGISKVRIYQDGSGVATLSSGITMKLKCAIGPEGLVVEQDQENSYLFYVSKAYPRDVAQKIARQARPMRWVFSPSADLSQLNGIKFSVAVSGNPDNVTIDNTYSRSALWKKIGK